MTTLAIVLAVLIILALAAYAWHLTRKVKQVETRQQEEQQQAEQQLRQRQQETVKDIRFLCQSVLTEQCDVTEGVMRIHYLVQSLDPASWAKEELQTTRQFHSQVADMPILADYKKLSPREQFLLDKQRLELEAVHKDEIHRELRWLHQHSFPAVFLIQ